MPTTNNNIPKESKLITKTTFTLIKILLQLNHYIFLNFPCKWNPKRKRYKTVKSDWYTVILYLHITRLFFLILIPGAYILLNRHHVSYFDLFGCSFTALFVLSLLCLHLLTTKDKGILGDLCNGVARINDRYGSVVGDLDGIKQQKALELNVKSAVGFIVMLLITSLTGYYLAIIMEFSKILNVVVEIHSWVGIPPIGMVITLSYFLAAEASLVLSFMLVFFVFLETTKFGLEKCNKMLNPYKLLRQIQVLHNRVKRHGDAIEYIIIIIGLNVSMPLSLYFSLKDYKLEADQPDGHHKLIFLLINLLMVIMWFQIGIRVCLYVESVQSGSANFKKLHKKMERPLKEYNYELSRLHHNSFPVLKLCLSHTIPVNIGSCFDVFQNITIDIFMTLISTYN